MKARIQGLGSALLFVLGALTCSSAACAQADDPAKPGEPHANRLEVGEPPPTTFSLASVTDGTIFDLEAARGERPLLLLFFRGTW